MGAGTVPEAANVRIARTVQWTGIALATALPEALLIAVASLLYALLILIAASLSEAQLSVMNPKQLEVPQERANVLLSTACQVVAQEFKVSDPSALRFSLVLVLEEKEEHYTVDEKKLEYKLFMKEWDETKFAALVMRLCVQRLRRTSRRRVY